MGDCWAVTSDRSSVIRWTASYDVSSKWSASVDLGFALFLHFRDALCNGCERLSLHLTFNLTSNKENSEQRIFLFNIEVVHMLEHMLRQSLQRNFKHTCAGAYDSLEFVRSIPFVYNDSFSGNIRSQRLRPCMEEFFPKRFPDEFLFLACWVRFLPSKIVNRKFHLLLFWLKSLHHTWVDMWWVECVIRLWGTRNYNLELAAN